MNYLFLLLLCMPWTMHAKHHTYYSKRQKAIITNYMLRNVHTKPNLQQASTKQTVTVCITYYTKHTDHNTAAQELQNTSAHTETIAPDNINLKETAIVLEQSIPTLQIIEQPRIKTIHDIIKFFKGQYPRPEDNTLFFEIVTQYFNTHWEYTFYATWKKNPDSYRETEILTKALIYLAQAYGKETQYTFYTGYEPYSIAYLLEHVCHLDTSSIIQLP